MNGDEDVDPDSETVCGLLVAVSVNESTALRVPDAVGLKTTEAVHEADAARVVPHVLLEILKSPAFVPDKPTLLMLIDVEPPLLSVEVCAALVEPTGVTAKVRLVGVTVTADVDVEPVPESDAVCGLLPAVSEIVKVAVRAPVVVGLNTTVTVQLAEAARLAPQLLAEILKSPAFVPVIDTLLIVIEDAPLFFNVVDCGVLVVPTFTVP